MSREFSVISRAKTFANLEFRLPWQNFRKTCRKARNFLPAKISAPKVLNCLKTIARRESSARTLQSYSIWEVGHDIASFDSQADILPDRMKIHTILPSRNCSLCNLLLSFNHSLSFRIISSFSGNMLLYLFATCC